MGDKYSSNEDDIVNSCTNAQSIELAKENSNDMEKNTSNNVTIGDKEEDNVKELEMDGGYGYVIILAVFLLNFNTWGMNSGFAIYFSHYLNYDTFDGASKIDYSFIGGIAFGLGVFLSPVITYLQGILGLKQLIIIGNIIQFAALMLASFSKKLWQLYLTQGVLQSFGLAFISLPGITILPQYFKQKRTLASGLGSAGSGVGGIVYNLGMQKVMEKKSVFWALRCQSIIAFGLVWIAILLIRDRQGRVKREFKVFDRDSLNCGAVYFVALYLITCMFGYVVVLYTLTNYTTSLGYSSNQGSIVAAMVLLGACLGRPTVGRLADKYGTATLNCIVYAICGILCLAMWIPCKNYATVIIFALWMGSLMGSIYGGISPLVARIVGLGKMNVAFGMLWSISGIAALFSPVIGVKLVSGEGGVVDPTQYRYCSVFAGVSFLVCSLSMLIVRGYLLARDTLILDTEDPDNGNDLYINVPVGLCLRSCFKWPKKRA